MGGRFSDDYEVAFYGVLCLFILAEGIELYIRAVSRDLSIARIISSRKQCHCLVHIDGFLTYRIAQSGMFGSPLEQVHLRNPE